MTCMLEDEPKVKRRAYHSRSFVFNHCKQFFNAKKIVCPVNGLDEKALYLELFQHLKHILIDYTEIKKEKNYNKRQ